jgi:hypothetical protein
MLFLTRLRHHADVVAWQLILWHSGPVLTDRHILEELHHINGPV